MVAAACSRNAGSSVAARPITAGAADHAASASTARNAPEAYRPKRMARSSSRKNGRSDSALCQARAASRASTASSTAAAATISTPTCAITGTFSDAASSGWPCACICATESRSAAAHNWSTPGCSARTVQASAQPPPKPPRTASGRPARRSRPASSAGSSRNAAEM